MTVEYSKLVNQKLSFSRLMIDELEAAFSVLKLAEANKVQDVPVVQNRRLIQAKFESILHHMSSALLSYLFEIDAFSQGSSVGQFGDHGDDNIAISLSQFKELQSKNSHNPSLEELKFLYQNPQSAVRKICDFYDSISQKAQSYCLPGEDTVSRTPNLIAIDESNHPSRIMISIEQLTEMIGELEEIFARQRAMSVED